VNTGSPVVHRGRLMIWSYKYWLARGALWKIVDIFLANTSLTVVCRVRLMIWSNEYWLARSAQWEIVYLQIIITELDPKIE
jgi:hypothetical protein